MIGIVIAIALAVLIGASSATDVGRVVVGASGRKWRTRPIVREGKAVLVEVVDVELGTMVIRYVEQDGKRFLAATAPTILVRTAMDDFGVQGPVDPSGKPENKKEIPPNPSPAVPVGKVRVDPGTYEANITVDFPASLVVTINRLREGIAGKGFTQVFVTDERPPGWGLAGDADYFVRVTWPNAPQFFDRPKAVSTFRKVA